MGKFLGLLCLALAAYSLYITNMYVVQTNRYSAIRELNLVENRLLKDQLYEDNSRPTYENGFRDAIIRAGSPSGAGSYRDGWEACAKLYSDGTWSAGYHTAIDQFGWKKEATAFKAIPMEAVTMK